MMALFEGFVNPMMVAGVGLAAVPIIIHLFNRQRHKPQPWAAMRFVLAAYKQTRRRVRFENWLLLLLRALAVAALALAIARPYTGSEGPLSGLTESRRDLAIVIDGSASTGFRNEVDTTFERIVARARVLVEELDGSRGDRCHLILGGSTPRLLAWSDPSQALAALEELTEPTDEELDLALALGKVLEFAEEEAASTEESRVEVRLLTDLQRTAFIQRDLDEEESEQASGGGSSPTTGLTVLLDRFEALGLSVQVEDLSDGNPVPPNLSIQAIEQVGPWLGVGVPVDVRVSVRNHGTTPKLGVRVSLEIDGIRRPSQVVDLGALEQAEAIFPTVFDGPGDHALVARLEGDHLAIDDQRAEVLLVPDTVQVLIVNGSPSVDFEKDAAARVVVVLEPALAEDSIGAAQAPFQPTEVEPHEIENGDVDLNGFDLVWLMNVGSLSPLVIEQLEEHVAAGASLMISLGDRVQAETFNKQFFAADGSGLSPAELREVQSVASRRTGYFRILSFDSTHPSLALFAEERWKSLLTEAPFYDFFSTRPLEQASVLAQLDDKASSALFLEREYDRGRVLLWTSSFDDSWTGFPTWGPALVPFVYDLVRDTGRTERPSRHVAPGGSLHAEVTKFPRTIELVRPDNTRRTIDDEALEVSNGRWQLPPIEGTATSRVGLYRVVTEGAGEHLFSVHLGPRESVLDRLVPGELEGLHTAFHLLSAESPEAQGDSLGSGRGELWRRLALAALLALVAESLWSAWIGRRRRIA